MTLRNNQIRQEYIEDEKNWIPKTEIIEALKEADNAGGKR